MVAPFRKLEKQQATYFVGKDEFDFGHVDFVWLLGQPVGNIHRITEVKDRQKFLTIFIIYTHRYGG